MKSEGVAGSVDGAKFGSNRVRTFFKNKCRIAYQASSNFNRIGFVNFHNAAKISAASRNKKKYNSE